MLVLSDTSNHPKLFVRYPEWQPVFDMDGDIAVATRKKLLDRAAADRMLVQGYHFPFPASGTSPKTAAATIVAVDGGRCSRLHLGELVTSTAWA